MAFFPGFGQRRSPQHLELMDFQDLNRKTGDLLGLLEYFFLALLRQSEDDVSASDDAAAGKGFSGLANTRRIVLAVHPHQCVVIHRFNAYLNREKGVSAQSFQIVETTVGKTVGTRTDDNAADTFHSKGFLITAAQGVDVCIGVGKRLKIGQITSAGIFVGKEALASLQLLGNGGVGLAVWRCETAVDAESASMFGQPSVSVGTVETGIDRKLLYTHAHPLPDPSPVVVVGQ